MAAVMLKPHVQIRRWAAKTTSNVNSNVRVNLVGPKDPLWDCPAVFAQIISLHVYRGHLKILHKRVTLHLLCTATKASVM
jgi:hypothetical protein